MRLGYVINGTYVRNGSHIAGDSQPAVTEFATLIKRIILIIFAISTTFETFEVYQTNSTFIILYKIIYCHVYYTIAETHVNRALATYAIIAEFCNSFRSWILLTLCVRDIMRICACYHVSAMYY
jgi:hypothetical protein